VHVAASPETCSAQNTLRRERIPKATSDSTDTTSSTSATSSETAAASTPSTAADTAAYDPPVLENLIFRYEEPNGMTRWDSPLFTVPHSDASPPCAAIWDALIGAPGTARKAVRPNAATVLRPAAKTGYLYELDRVTSEIVGVLVGWLREREGMGQADEGGEVEVPVSAGAGAGGGSDRNVKDGKDGREMGIVRLPVGTKVGVPMLQRLRRQFIALNRVNEVEKRRIGTLFVDYLNDAFER